MEKILGQLLTVAPVARQEFLDFVQLHYQFYFDKWQIQMQDLPTELGLGIFFKFFEENAIEFSVGDLSLDLIYQDIIDTFKNYEKVTGHFS